MSRYARQERFAPVGPEGQARLRAARVLVVGVGGLGSALAETMARAGVGRLTIVDRDLVEPSNLQRQSLFDEDDARLARPKAVAAAERLRRINSEVAVEAHVADLDAELARELLAGADLALDGSDSFETRYLLNDACLCAGVPWVYGAVVAAQGVVLAVRPRLTPCLRCVLGERPPALAAETCEAAGVIAPAVQAVAALQAAEALKLLCGREEALLAGLATLDLWAGSLDVAGLTGRAPWCPACVAGRYDYAEAPPAPAAALCGRGAVQVRGGGPLDLPLLAARLRGTGEVLENGHLVRYRSPSFEGELIVFGDGRAIVKGTEDAARARSLYARYVGA